MENYINLYGYINMTINPLTLIIKINCFYYMGIGMFSSHMVLSTVLPFGILAFKANSGI